MRAATDDRCSECGLVIDRLSLERSGIPWAYRRQFGGIRAFVKTVWLMTLDAKSLRHEAAKPQSVRDAAGFRRRVAMLLVLGAAVVTAMFIREDGIEQIVLQKPASFSLSAPLSGYAQDLAVPWSAGIALRPALIRVRRPDRNIFCISAWRGFSYQAHAA